VRSEKLLANLSWGVQSHLITGMPTVTRKQFPYFSNLYLSNFHPPFRFHLISLSTYCTQFFSSPELLTWNNSHNK